MFPFADKRNVVFCSADYRDLPTLLAELAQDENLCATIGRYGRYDWRRWSTDTGRLLNEGVVNHLWEAVGFSGEGNSPFQTRSLPSHSPGTASGEVSDQPILSLADE